jgi:hypothetical protein
MRVFAALTVVVVVMLAALGGSATADPTNQHWLVVTQPGEPTRVLARGVIDAEGIVTDVLTLNPDGTFDNLATQHFPDGDLFYHGAGTYEIDVNQSSCHGIGDVVGPFDITGGTGAYAGASGNGVALIHLRFVFEQTPTGCSLRPTKVSAIAHAKGTLELP